MRQGLAGGLGQRGATARPTPARATAAAPVRSVVKGASRVPLNSNVAHDCASSSCAGAVPASSSSFGRSAAHRSRRAAVAMAAATPVPGDACPPSYMDNFPDWNRRRRAGVLLHPTSLPGPYGIGELGAQAMAFVDWLSEAGMQCWQVLPLVPPDPQFFSPYSGTDANCGNPLLICLEGLINDGLLQPNDRPAPVPVADVDFAAVAATKTPLLAKAARTLLSSEPRFDGLRAQFEAFRSGHPWVEDSALFDVLRRQPGLDTVAWWDWPEALRFRDPAALSEARQTHAQAINEFVAVQFLFDRQWRAVKAYANNAGIAIIGDMPIYVGGHSADVWANQGLFELSPTGAPALVSGVPPDAFSATGQLWGSPLYNWPAHEKEGYSWWAARVGRAMQLYDETRIDHFRGFAGYWSVDATAETAMDGIWRQGPGLALFDALKAKLGRVPILAEDLGVITTDVVELREAIGAPGMVVLQFAWGGGPSNVHLPHMHEQNMFVYTGTHDNETAVGWFKGSANATDKKYLTAYMCTEGKDIAWDFIREAMNSVARTAIFPLQDVMRLDNSARMNTPGVAAGNWAWRVGDANSWRGLLEEAHELKRLAYVYNRLPKGSEFSL